MDKVVKYRQLVKQVAVETGELGERPDNPVKTQFILDDERGHYLLYFNGWRESRRTYGCYFHVDVDNDGKVWIQHDGTDLAIAEILVDRGIPKADIVLAFHSPVKRPDTGYAIS